MSGEGSVITMNGATLTTSCSASSVATFMSPTTIIAGETVTVAFAGVSPTCAGAYPRMPCAAGTGELHPKLFSCVWTCPDGQHAEKNVTMGPFHAHLWQRQASSSAIAASQVRIDCAAPRVDELGDLCGSGSTSTPQLLRLMVSHTLAGPLAFAGLPDGDRVSCEAVAPPPSPSPATPPPPPPSPPPPMDCTGKEGKASIKVGSVMVNTFCEDGWLLIGKGSENGQGYQQTADVGAFANRAADNDARYLDETMVRLLAAKSSMVRLLSTTSTSTGWGEWTHGVVSAPNSDAIKALRNGQDWGSACGRKAESCSWSTISGKQSICFDQQCGSVCSGEKFPCLFQSCGNGGCAHIGYQSRWSTTTANMVMSMWVDYRG